MEEDESRVRRSAMFCSYCGTNLPDDAGFCHQCGKRQIAVANSSATNVSVVPESSLLGASEASQALSQHPSEFQPPISVTNYSNIISSIIVTIGATYNGTPVAMASAAISHTVAGTCAYRFATAKSIA